MYNYIENRYLTSNEVEAILPAELRAYYHNTHLDTVVIEGNEIHGYFDYSYLDEKTYNKQPQRAIGGRLDLSTYTSFLTAHLLMKFKYFHIEDYRKVMRLIQSKDEVSVSCYDIVSDSIVTRNMYFKPTKMPLLHQVNLQVQGVRDFEIELVGTNTDTVTNTVIYDFNFPSNAKLYVYNEISKEYDKLNIEETSSQQEFSSKSSDIVGLGAKFKNIKTDSYILANSATIFSEGKLYKLEKWNDDKVAPHNSGFSYIDGNAYYINQPITLYANWQKALNTNAKLTNIVVDGYQISPTFEPDVFLYNITVDNTVNSVNVNATPEVVTSKAIITGGKQLTAGNNIIHIVVKAEAGNEQIYTIVVYKEQPKK